VRQSYQIRWVFLSSSICWVMIGLPLILLAGNDSWNHSTARWILWNTCDPLIRAADGLLGLVFTHNRIGPSFAQVLLVDGLFVLFCGLALGLICTTAAGALKFICSHLRTRTG
jgi:hypothetical protein